MRRAFLILTLVVLAGAGCGVRTSKPYTADGSVGCLREKGFTGVTTRPQDVGVIAGFAANGGLKARAPSGNVVTIAFAEDEPSTKSTQQAFRFRAPKSLRPHIGDIMRTERNAVLVWTVTPTPDEYDVARRCLRP